MNINDELKLAIYESALDADDKADLVSIVESTDDEEVLESVIEVLEASKEEADRLAKSGANLHNQKINDRKKSFVNMSNNPKFNDLNSIALSNNRLSNRLRTRNEKYGLQYSKMTGEKKRRKDINFNFRNEDSRRQGHGRTGVNSSDYRDDSKYEINRDYNKKHMQSYIKTEVDKEWDKSMDGDMRAYQKATNLENKNAIINNLKKKYANKPEKLKELESKLAKNKHTLESVDLEETKLSVYEACYYGDISVEERDTLLSYLE